MDRLLLTCLALLALSPLVLAGPPAEKAEARTDRYGDPLPEGAVARLGTIRFRHGGRILSVAFSPDSKSVATAGADLRLWDVASGKQIHSYSGHDSTLHSVDFTPDGKFLIAADWCAVRVYCWDVASGRLLWHFESRPLGREMRAVDPVNLVRHVALAPDGKTLATTERGLRLWNVTTGEGLGELRGEGKSIRLVCLTFSPDSRVLAAGDYEGHIRMWDVAKKQAGVVLSGHTDSALCMAYSPDGKTLASAGKDCRVRLWDPLAGKAIREISVGGLPVQSIAFTAEGKSLMTASPDRITLWDPVTGKEIRRYSGQGGPFSAVALSPDGKLIAAGGQEGVLRLWQVATGKPAVPFQGHDGAVCALAYSPDGRTLAAGGSRDTLLWEVKEQRLLRRLGEDGAPCYSIAYSGDGRYLLWADGKSLRLWDTTSSMPRAEWRSPEDSVEAGLISPDGTRVLSRHISGICRVWKPGSEKPLREVGERRGKDQLGPGPGICVPTCDWSVVATGGINAPTKLWRVADGRLVRQMGEGADGGLSAAASPDGKTLAVGAEDVCLFELATGREARQMKGHKPWVHALAFSPDGRTLASADGEQYIRLWEVSTGNERRRYKECQKVGFDVTCLGFSPDGKLLASGGEDTTILVWGVTLPFGKATTYAAGLSEKELNALWATVADDHAGGAYEAMCRLINRPDQAVPFIKDRLLPVPHADPKKLAQLVKDLDAEEFDVREKASQDMAKYEEVAEPALKEVLKGNSSAEARRRAEELLARLHKNATGDALRALRAVEVLEHIGTPEACQLLRSLADGAPEARLTRDARASLDRLAKRPAAKP